MRQTRCDHNNNNHNGETCLYATSVAIRSINDDNDGTSHHFEPQPTAQPPLLRSLQRREKADKVEHKNSRKQKNTLYLLKDHSISLFN